MPKRIWTKEVVAASIRMEAEGGHDLSYSQIEKRVPALLRAAQRTFGSWSKAVAAAGLDYDSIRRYRKWTRDAVIERIQELHTNGMDLSWRNISTGKEAPLAAAALHAGRFHSWNDALIAAGLDPESIRRYRKWSRDTVRRELAKLAKDGISLDQDTLASVAPAVLAAVYRRGAGLVAEREAARQLALFDVPD